jgi:hypothetical protein
MLRRWLRALRPFLLEERALSAVALGSSEPVAWFEAVAWFALVALSGMGLSRC